MRLELETVLLLGLATLLFPFVYIYLPVYREGLVFYMIIAISSAVTIFLLTAKFPINIDNKAIFETAVYVFINMMLNAIFFASLVSVFSTFSMIPSIYLVLTGAPLLYSLYVALGETLLFVGVPFAISERFLRGLFRYIPAVTVNLLFGIYFALLHANAYDYNFIFLLQPFVAYIINAILAVKYRNITGVILGHWLTDFVIFMSGVAI